MQLVAPVPAGALAGLLALLTMATSGAVPAADAHREGAHPTARAARTVPLSETGRLHSTGDPGVTIDERGTATGTYDCAITVHLVIVSANRVTATFTVSPKGGTITGTGSASFVAKGSNGYFGGTIAISRGTGVYRHASGADMGISGVISRETFNLTVHVHGVIHV